MSPRRFEYLGVKHDCGVSAGGGGAAAEGPRPGCGESVPLEKEEEELAKARKSGVWDRADEAAAVVGVGVASGRTRRAGTGLAGVEAMGTGAGVDAVAGVLRGCVRTVGALALPSPGT